MFFFSFLFFIKLSSYKFLAIRICMQMMIIQKNGRKKMKMKNYLILKVYFEILCQMKQRIFIIHFVKMMFVIVVMIGIVLYVDDVWIGEYGIVINVINVCNSQ